MNRTKKALLFMPLLLGALLLVGWDELVTNFLGKPLAQPSSYTNGDVWSYNSSTGKYTLGAIAAGSIDEVIRLEELSDVATMTEATGDIIYRTGGGAWDRLGIGATGTYARSNGTLPTWSAILAGDLPAHASRHENGGADEISVTGLSGLLADAQKVAVDDEGTLLATRAKLNFVGAGVTVTDDAANDEIDITIPGGGGGGAGDLQVMDGAVETDPAVATMIFEGPQFNVTQGAAGTVLVMIATSGVTVDSLSADSVTGAKVVDATLTADDLGADSVDASELKSTAIEAGDVEAADVAEVITAAQLSDVTVTSLAEHDVIARNGSNAWVNAALAGDVTGSLASNTYTLTIGADKVTSAKILDDEIVNADIDAAAGIVYGKLAFSNNIVAGDLAANSVDVSEIVGGAPGAAGAEFADSVTNVTGATDLTITATGDEVVLGDQIKLFGTTSDPTNEQDVSYDTTDGVAQAKYKVGRVTTPGMFFRTSAASTAITATGDQDFDNASFSLPADVFQVGTVIDYEFWGSYSTDASPGVVTFKLRKGSTVLAASVGTTMPASETGRGWRISGSIVAVTTTTVNTSMGVLLGAFAGANRKVDLDAAPAAVTIGTGAEALKLTVNFDAAGDSYTCRGGWLRIN